MRIAIFTEVFLPKVDGITNTLSHTITRLCASGDEVLIFAPETAAPTFNSCRVVRFKGVVFRPYPEIGFTLPSYRIVSELMRFDPDVVHIVGPAVLGVWGTFVSFMLRYPIVTSYHTDFPKYMPYYKMGSMVRFTWPATRLVHNRARYNLCPSAHTRSVLQDQGIRNLKIWRGGVDCETFSPAHRCEKFRQEVGATDRETLIALYVGRLGWEKNVEQIESLAIHFPQVQIVLVGDGPAREHLKGLFAGKRCHFTGYLTGRALSTAFASADFFVMPSQSETFGLVTLEAMSSGLPVLAARAGGTTDIVQHEHNGLLYDPSDDRSFLAGAQRLVEDSGLRDRLRRKGRESAEQASWQTETAQLRDLYLSAARSRQSWGARAKAVGPYTVSDH